MELWLSSGEQALASIPNVTQITKNHSAVHQNQEIDTDQTLLADPHIFFKSQKPQEGLLEEKELRMLLWLTIQSGITCCMQSWSLL